MEEITIRKHLSTAVLLAILVISAMPGAAQASWALEPGNTTTTLEQMPAYPVGTVQRFPINTANSTTPSVITSAAALQNRSTEMPTTHTYTPATVGPVYTPSVPTLPARPTAIGAVTGTTAGSSAGTATPAYSAAPAPAQASTGSGVPLAADEVKMLSLVNNERAKAGLKPVTLNASLAEVARKKSQDILANNYFDHSSPTYGLPGEMVRAAGIRFRAVGENLAKAKDTTWAHGRLMASPGHASNVLNPIFTQVGIGIVSSPTGVIVTQLFILPY